MEKINDIVLIKTDLIIPNPFQPRKFFDDSSIIELGNSIKEYGILQPITVRKSKDKFELIMGERRYRAAKSIRLNVIPAIILDVTNKDSAVVALIENIQRVDLSFVEEAESYKKLIEIHGLKQKDLSQKISKSQSAISNKLRLLKLDNIILDKFKQSNLTERHARALLKIDDLDTQIEILDRIIEKNMNVKDTEILIDKKNFENKKVYENSKFKINYKIYFNTIKKAFKMVKSLSPEADMDVIENDNFLEINIKIPKR